PQTRRLLHPLRDRRGRAREHEALEAVGLRERVLHREHAAPGVAEEVDPVEPERRADRLHLLDEELDRPVETGGRRAAAADLVVEHGAPAGRREPEERLEVVVRRSRSTVQAERGPLARRGLALLPVPRGGFADATGPCFAYGDTTQSGTRTPSPYASTTGGATWSKKPPCSS